MIKLNLLAKYPLNSFKRLKIFILLINILFNDLKYPGKTGKKKFHCKFTMVVTYQGRFLLTQIFRTTRRKAVKLLDILSNLLKD